MSEANSEAGKPLPTARVEGQSLGMSFALSTLEQTIRNRRDEHAANSYSVELLEDREQLLRKIMEEAFEFSLEIGRIETQPDRVANEAADVIYHLMVGLVAVNVGLDDVLGVLEERSR
jgi:phosphoribosyl-ATP pyrophosphohydrolase/phosphoribosyl-AMP cyclohydrolase